jgi:hypothetical protein
MTGTSFTTRSRQSGARTVLRARLHQNQPTDTTGPTSGTALGWGFDDATYQPGRGLYVNGRPYPGTPRHLSQMLGPRDAGPFFLDATTLQHAIYTDDDPLMYDAYRDILPRRPIPSGSGTTRVGWSADLVIYQGGVLQTGEPIRSTGHWNTPNQLEIFQTLTGRNLMIVAGWRADGSRYIYRQISGPGDVVVVPFGAWHLTYVLDGPAAVFNIYADRHGVPQQHSSRAASEDDEFKYRHREPVRVAARDGDGGLRVIGPDAAAIRWGHPRDLDGIPQWFNEHLGPETALADLYITGSVGRLAQLMDAADRAWRDQDWALS